MHAVAEKIYPKLELSEAPGTRDTLRDRVVPAVPEEDCTLLGTQITRSAAVDVGHHTSAKQNRIVDRDRLQASRTLRFRHFCTFMDRRQLVNTAFDQLM